MDSWGTILLGVIALGSLVQALVVIGVAVGGLRVARRLQDMQVNVDRELKPALESLTRVAHNATEVAEVVTTQARRVENMVGLTLERLELAREQVRGRVARPMASLADVGALLKGFRKGLSVYRQLGGLEEQAGGGKRRYRDDDEHLFI
jgi:hypothetical protein